MKNRLLYKYFDRQVVDINCGYKEAVNRINAVNLWDKE